MELTTTYILSQIFTVVSYIFMAATYFTKDRKTILILSFMVVITNGIAFIFLNAYSGLAMCVVAILRNIIFLFGERENKKTDKMTKEDIIVLIGLYIISIVLGIFTYNGVLSLLSIIGTMLYTYSVCQKNTKVYKILGIPVSALWICYNIYILSIFGVILESIMLICSTTGVILENRRMKKDIQSMEIIENK